jgi:Tol biopolymer transport system component
MRRRLTKLAIVVLLLLSGAGCSDRLAAPVEEPMLPAAALPLPELIVSDARRGNAAADGTFAESVQLAYVALPPGSLPTVTTVRIRNLSGVDPGVTVPVIDGGFDPVPIPATAGDQLELTLTHSTGAVSVAYAPVPPNRRPVVVRTFPTKGRTDVALSIIPTMIFSEPIDASTLAMGVRLFQGDEEVEVAVELAADPWEARVVPAAQLEPATDYELRITSDVRDLEGDSLETSLTIPFTTAVSPPLTSWGSSRIAFLDIVDGNSRILVGDSDGTIAPLRRSGVCQVGSPDAPQLSPDGTEVMFLTDVMGPANICVTAVDGSSERSLGIWGVVAWSPDGTRILFLNGTGLHTINADGSGPALLVGSESLPPGISDLNVSPDGTIAFGNGAIWLMDADGSRLRRIGEPGLSLYDPDWSPDGARIAYVAGGDRKTIGSMAADGSDARIHFRADAEGQQLGDPEWSPDGRSIAFTYTGRSPSTSGIYVVDVETAVVAQLVPGVAWSISWAPVSPPLASWGSSRIAFDGSQIFLGQPDGTLAPLRHSGVCDILSGYGPRLSPDGTRLLFLVSGMAPEYICMIDLDGSNDRRFDWGFAAWSADGTRILSVEGQMVGGVHRQQLYTIKADGSDAKRLLSDSLPDISNLDVSPDGTIAFGTYDGEIWLMDGDGSSLRRVGRSDLALYDPDWSPDGARIAYGVTVGDRRVIGSMAADGSDARIHFQTAPGERAHGPEWSPDGRSIAFALQASTGGSTGIHVVNLESGAVARLVDGAVWSISWAAVNP